MAEEVFLFNESLETTCMTRDVDKFNGRRKNVGTAAIIFKVYYLGEKL